MIASIEYLKKHLFECIDFSTLAFENGNLSIFLLLFDFVNLFCSRFVMFANFCVFNDLRLLNYSCLLTSFRDWVLYEQSADCRYLWAKAYAIKLRKIFSITVSK